eukprot:3619789-Amphidinium_carterae.1
MAPNINWAAATRVKQTCAQTSITEVNEIHSYCNGSHESRHQIKGQCSVEFVRALTCNNLQLPWDDLHQDQYMRLLRAMRAQGFRDKVNGMLSDN